MRFLARSSKDVQTAAFGLLGYAVFCCTTYFCAAAHAEMLLLQSGAVLKGEVSEAAEEWIVTNPTGQLKVRKSDTLARGQSAQDLYRWQRSQLIGKTPTIDFHLRLADWCLGQELWAEASRELLDARQLNAQSPQLQALERRLIQMSESANSNLGDAKPSESVVVNNTMRIDWQAIEEAWHVENEQAAQFARKIQPLLVNNCTTSGCHRVGSANEYQLDTSLRQGRSTADSTRHNLLATLATLDQKKISESRLLEAARGPHADWSGLTGRNRDAWIAMLEGWVQSVADSNQMPGKVVADLANKSADSSTDTDAKVAQKEIDQPKIDSKNPPATNSQPFTPRDEFDPEIFNRLFRDSKDQ